MEHHASELAKFLTDLFHLSRHAWAGFANGMPLSVLERFDHLLNAVLAALCAMAVTGIVRAKMARVPGGLIVGRVGDSISEDRQGDNQTVPVIPLVTFEGLQVVTVVLTDGP